MNVIYGANSSNKSKQQTYRDKSQHISLDVSDGEQPTWQKEGDINQIASISLTLLAVALAPLCLSQPLCFFLIINGGSSDSSSSTKSNKPEIPWLARKAHILNLTNNSSLLQKLKPYKASYSSFGSRR